MRDLSAFFSGARMGRITSAPKPITDVWSGNPDTDRYWR